MNWIKRLFLRRRIYHDLSEEIQEHLEEKIDELIASGMSREDATHAARREFGNATLIEELGREVWQWRSVESLIADIRYALRMLRKNPGFTVVAVVTLTLGIGATTAIFSVVDAVLLRPLAYRDPGGLVYIYENRSSTGFPRKQFTPANYADCKTQAQIFEAVAAVDADRFYTLTSTGTFPERLWAEGVTWNLFPMLGTTPVLGRVFLPEEDRPGGEHVVLISYRLWQGRFGGDPSVVGRDLVLDNEKYTIVGVMPHWFSFPTANADLWIPIAFTSQDLADRGSHFLSVYARLRRGVSVQQANADLMVLSQRLKRQHLDIMRFVDGFVAERMQDTYTRDVRTGLIALMIAVTFILLIACANIANLLLSRAGVRRREIALRSALGASRGRIVRQLLTESAVLAAAGGTLGVLFARSSFSFLSNLIPADLLRTISPTLDPTVLGVVVLSSFVSTFLFGLAPAMRTSRADINASLKEGGRGSTGTGSGSLNSLLVAGEIALCLMLLVGSGLLLETFAKLHRGYPGFSPDHVLTVAIPVPQTRNPDFTRRSQFFQTVLDRVRALPGVTNAAFTSVLPLTWQRAAARFSGMASFLPEGLARPDISYTALDRVISPGYFETMRIPLVRGRLLDDSDGPSAQLVAVVNETMARVFWPNQDVVGKRFRFIVLNGRTPWVQIVGVVGDVKELGLNEPATAEMYFPYWQAEGNYMQPGSLVSRTTGDPINLANSVRRAVWSVDPQQPVSDVTTMDDVLNREVEPTRFQAFLLGSFAGLALVLACVGIYGVTAYLVAQRNHEIGIRMALGARPGTILRLVLARGALLTVTGVGAGVGAAVVVTRFMRSLLYGVTPTDPLTIASAAILLALVALAACYLPARRAMRVDPIAALRCE